MDHARVMQSGDDSCAGTYELLLPLVTQSGPSSEPLIQRPVPLQLIRQEHGLQLPVALALGKEGHLHRRDTVAGTQVDVVKLTGGGGLPQRATKRADTVIALPLEVEAVFPSDRVCQSETRDTAGASACPVGLINRLSGDLP